MNLLPKIIDFSVCTCFIAYRIFFFTFITCDWNPLSSAHRNNLTSTGGCIRFVIANVLFSDKYAFLFDVFRQLSISENLNNSDLLTGSRSDSKSSFSSSADAIS